MDFFCPQNPVGIQQASVKSGFQTVRKHQLENVSLMDVMLDLLHLFTVAFLIKQRRELRRQSPCGHVFSAPDWNPPVSSGRCRSFQFFQ